MEVHLLGINHQYQWCEAESTLRTPLANYLISYCENFQPSLIAEEFSEEALQSSRVAAPNGSVAWSVAALLKIKHAFCDPNTQTRAQLGIPTYSEIRNVLGLPLFGKSAQEHDESTSLIEMEIIKYWHIREKYWLSELVKINADRVFFLVGEMHIHRFMSLLEENYNSVVIANESWKP